MGNFELENKLFITSRQTIQTLFREESGYDAIALYFFYYETAKRQETDQVRATDNFVMKGIKWGEKRFRTAKSILKKHNLIENVKAKSSNGDWYLKINYVKRTTPQSHGVQLSSTTPQKEVLRSRGQMLNNNININAYTLTNVRDNATPNRGTSCPLSRSPLKEKWPKGHIECAEYVTSFKFVNKGKQFKFLHTMLRAGLDFPDIDKIIARVKTKPFFKDNGWDFATLASEADRSSNANK